jgi:oxalate decarboxylase/phosphoglucose isomerase-like protein (cupin superfamily)
MQSVLAAEIAPSFEADHRLDLVDASVPPRLWIGNAVTVAAHYDPSENIACVLAGRRRFTLFPPQQVENLYVGPLERTPAGASVSLITQPGDAGRFPRFETALAAAQAAELGPGDAIYIPYLWWHQVESLEPLNLLANYWWSPSAPERGEPHAAFLHAVMALGVMSEPHRRAWRALFDHYAFKMGDDPADHIPLAHRGILGETDAETILAMRRELARLIDPDR